LLHRIFYHNIQQHCWTTKEWGKWRSFWSLC